MKRNKGFTLIELLTVISILSILGTISVQVITTTLSTSKKTDLLNFAQQNGDQALTQMVKSIRYAQTITAPATCVPTVTTNAITITNLLDQAQTTYSCNANTISSNSASLIDTTSLKVTGCSFVCTQQTISSMPIITIQFTLQPKTAGNFAETNFTLPFQTSVTMQNYGQVILP